MTNQTPLRPPLPQRSQSNGQPSPASIGHNSGALTGSDVLDALKRQIDLSSDLVKKLPQITINNIEEPIIAEYAERVDLAITTLAKVIKEADADRKYKIAPAKKIVDGINGTYNPPIKQAKACKDDVVNWRAQYDGAKHTLEEQRLAEEAAKLAAQTGISEAEIADSLSEDLAASKPETVHTDTGSLSTRTKATPQIKDYKAFILAHINEPWLIEAADKEAGRLYRNGITDPNVEIVQKTIYVARS